VSPGDLGTVLSGLPPIRDPKVLVGIDTRDDAAVYRLDDETAVVQSVDVFTPVVDDPYAFGQVAAANALSDIYAMGARPILALSIIGFPVEKLPISDMSRILRGGIDKAREAGIEIVGGHSLEDNEPKYGLCVTGLVHPDKIVRNCSAKPGDVLVLTKPLGSGVLTHAIKKGLATQEETREVVEVMTQLNRDASEIMVEVGVSACTDVTGFGLLGHLMEMLLGSGVSARVRVCHVPVLASVRARIREGVYPGGTRKNLEFYGRHADWAEDVEEIDRLVLADAQTSGGLLISVPRERTEDLKKGLASRGLATRVEIGDILPLMDGPRVRFAKE
jgi:selenide, water dikinase